MGKKKSNNAEADHSNFEEQASGQNRVYRDGLGNIIKEEDLILREKLNEELVQKFSRRVEYTGNLRAGSVIYTDPDTRIEFSNEMGGGNCLAFIYIPTEQQWEEQTKTPLSRRKEILEFVAAAVKAQQASNCDVEIRDDMIGFYYK